jgi:polyvinyl alcohol dehydrogenase (cytochrome)
VVCDPNAPTRSETCPPNRARISISALRRFCALRTLPNGDDILLIGQKSGVGWALDPEKQGAVLWQDRIGKGTTLGGIEWGSPADSSMVYFANADAGWGPEQAGGLAAVNIADGKRVWFTRPPPAPCQSNDNRNCIQAQGAAITLIPGVVFSGAGNGIMRAYAATDGKIVWEYDTAHDYTTVNGVPARGGGINGPGPAIAGGMLYMNSGYSVFGQGAPGNVLLAFTVE